MSPYGRDIGGGAPWLWRSLLLGAFLLIAAIIWRGSGLIGDNQHALRLITQTSCLFGRAITSTPPTRTSGTSRQQFRETLVLEGALLHNLREEDCSRVAHGQVTRGEIRSGLYRIHRAERRHGFTGGGGSSSGVPSASPPWGGTTGGTPGPSPSPPPTHTVTSPAPPPATTTTTTTTTVPAPSPPQTCVDGTLCLPNLTGPGGILPRD